MGVSFEQKRMVYLQFVLDETLCLERFIRFLIMRNNVIFQVRKPSEHHFQHIFMIIIH